MPGPDEPLIPPPTPYGQDPRVQAAVRAMLQHMIEPALEAGRALQRKPQRPGLWSEEDEFLAQLNRQRQVEGGAELGMNLMGLGGARALGGASPGLGIFAGKTAKTANLEMLAKAEAMEKAGRTRTDIRNATGWERTRDGKDWHYEVSDDLSKLKDDPGLSGRMKGHFEHPDLYKAYPEAANIKTERHDYMGKGVLGGYDPGDKSIHYLDPQGMGALMSANPEATPRKTLLHELQHWIQGREGWPIGTNPNPAEPGLPSWGVYQKALKSVRSEAKEKGITLTAKDRASLKAAAGREAYKRSAGENQAFATMERADLSPFERGRRDPALDQVVPYDQQIVDYGSVSPGKVVPSDLQLLKADEPALINKKGLPIQGTAYSKASRGALEEIAARPKGEGPLDLSLMDAPLTAPQRPLPRFDPPRGVSERLTDAMADPAIAKGILESMEAGRALGADRWYLTQPVRQAFIDRLGPEQGAWEFKNFADMLAATSPRSDVPTNIRNASFYFSKMGGRLPAQNPYPYGHVAQNLHRQNFQNLTRKSGDMPGWDVFQNPKPASFSENLQGNLMPVTVDTHAYRNIAMRSKDPRFLETSISELYRPGKNPAEDTLARDYGRYDRKSGKVIYRPQELYEKGKLDIEEAQGIPKFWAAQPRENEYGAAERFYAELARRQGMDPASGQAAAWSGAGDLTGLGTRPDRTFPELMNERITYTAKMRGQTPERVLDDLILKKIPLLGMGGLVAGGALMGAEPELPQ